MLPNNGISLSNEKEGTTNAYNNINNKIRLGKRSQAQESRAV